MTTEHALRKLKALRIREKKTRQERLALIAFLKTTTADWNGKKAREKRNLKMYKLWKKGIRPKEIALSFDLKPERIRDICHRVEIQERRRAEKKTLKK